MIVPLPIGEPDDVSRLRWIAEETARRNTKSRPPDGTLFRSIALSSGRSSGMPPGNDS